MDDFESRLNSILSSPDSLEKIKQIAQSFASGNGDGETTAPAEKQALPELPSLLTKAMGDWAKPSEAEKIMRALQPYLSEERGKRLDRALKFAKIYKAAKKFLPELGGPGNDEPI